MGNTASSSRKTVSKNLQEIIEWRIFRPDEEAEKPLTESYLSVVLDYVLKVDFEARSYTNERHDFKNTEEVRQLFQVPKIQQLSERDKTLKKHELVAAFVNFLLHVLYHKTDSMNSFETQIDILKKDLRFLLVVLGDAAFIDDAEEQHDDLLAEFEAVANDVGRFLHFFTFEIDRLFNDALLKRIDVLKANIIEFSNLQPFSSKAAMTTPKTTSVYVDSLFIVDSLLCDLEDLLNLDDTLIVDVKDQIKILHHELLLSMSFIKGIKFPQRHFEKMGELKDAEKQIARVAYEAEYLINSFLVGDAPLSYLNIRLPHVIHKISLIRTIGLQDIKKDYEVVAFKVAEDSNAGISSTGKRIFEVDNIIVGFDDRVTDILEQLLGGTQQLQTISIWGMPGLGKTTLAKKLYDHPAVTYRFDKRTWCVVSQIYQRKRLLRDMLMSLTSDCDKDRILNTEEEDLVEKIYKNLKGRRYLIVMDDIWDSNAWDGMRRCFPDDGNGSRILFTSRNKDVMPPNSFIHALPLLSNGQCWELLEKKVFCNMPCPPQLQQIGKEIATNCHGLPLAVVVTAGILSTMDKDESTWEKMRGYLASYDNSMMQIVELSYKNLPDHLKPCFLYFGAFPEDEEIPVRKLMRLWIAEGFICTEERKNSEIAAEEYLMELIDKSLVIIAKRRWDGGVKACVIHDLLRDFCLKRSEEENFVKLVEDSNYSIYEKGYHLLSLRRSISPFSQHIRSFHGNYDLDKPFSVLHMKLLRVLDFKITHSRYAPSPLIGIEFLVNLRYLVITELPTSIGSLVNLEHLHVESDYNVVTPIPLVILKMVKLRYFFVARASFEQDWNSSQTDNNLESLSWIEVKNQKDEEKLKCWPHLRKLKCKCGPFDNEKKRAKWFPFDGWEYRFPDLSFLTQLESLNINAWFGRRHSTFEDINFPSNIKKLNLCRLGLAWELMSIIGRLSNLEVLKLRDGAFVGQRWDTRDGEFQQLRYLKLEKLQLSQWNVSSSDHFPMLQRLVLSNCFFFLQEVPPEIGEIVTLQSIELKGNCRKSLVESAVQIEQEQRDYGNEELRVILTDIWNGKLFFSDFPGANED